MEKDFNTELTASIQKFHLPRYNEIPNVGLFLEQTTKYISDILMPLHSITITSSMISNYVKKKLIPNPVKKQYDRDQVAYLIFIAVAKSVLSLENVQTIIDLQKRSYENKRAYDYFCRVFEDFLFYVFELSESLNDDGRHDTREAILLRNTIIAVVHKIYLETSIKLLTELDKAEEE